MWCRINWSMVEYSAGSSDLQRDEGCHISNSAFTNCRVSLHLWSMRPTQLRISNHHHTHIPQIFVLCLISHTRIFNRCSPSYISMTLQVIEELWCDISRNPTRMISSTMVSTTRDITHMLCLYVLATSFNRSPVSGAATLIASNWASCLSIFVLLRIHTPVDDHYWSNNPARQRVLDDHCTRIQLARFLPSPSC